MSVCLYVCVCIYTCNSNYRRIGHELDRQWWGIRKELGGSRRKGWVEKT